MGPHKRSERLNYSITELARFPHAHLNKLLEVPNRLGYPEDTVALALRC